MTMDLKGWLFGRVLRLQEQSTPGAPWRPSVYSIERARFEGIGILASPMLAPGGLRACAQIVVFPGEPPDPVTLGGDYVYLVPYQPDFLLGRGGDLTLLEGGS